MPNFAARAGVLPRMTSKGEFRACALVLACLACTLVLAVPARGYYSGARMASNPLAGYAWYVDKTRGSWWVALHQHPSQAAPLRAYADNPMGKTFASFVSDPESDVSSYLSRAEREQPGSIPFLNLSRIEGQSCPWRPQYPKDSLSSIESWVAAFSRGVGDHHVEIAIETDRLAVIYCLPRWAQARRYQEIGYEVHLLHQNNPNAIVYIDAGASNWGTKPSVMAARLRNADVAEAQGFQLGASHFDWTSNEVSYGLAISRLLGGKHFIVNTNANGWGPKPRYHSSSYHPGCTPTGEGLGFRPSVNTPDPQIDAFVWSGVPGYESGDCLGYGPNSPYQFYLSFAVSLARNANPRG